MEAVITAIAQQGPLGLIAGLFIYLYMSEKKKNSDLQNKVAEIHKYNYDTLDKVRESQIAREQEVTATLEAYGKGVIEAVQHASTVVDELRRLHGGRN